MNANPPITYKILDKNDLNLFEAIAIDVFDYPVKLDLSAEFLNDQRHHIVVAIANQQIIGMATGFHYIHPDKAAEMFINEIGVTPDFRRQGIATQLLNRLLEHARSMGCKEAWVLTETDNQAAAALYQGIAAVENERPLYYSIRLDQLRSKN